MSDREVSVLVETTILTVEVAATSVIEPAGGSVAITESPTVVEVVTVDTATDVELGSVTILEVSESGPQGPPGVSEDDVAYDTEVDETTPGVVYVGQAAPGTAATTAAWRIKRITEGTGTTSVDWAAGTADFDKQWSLRGSYSYGP